TSFGRRNRMGKGLDIVKYYHEKSVIRNDIDPKEATLDFSKNLVVGKFVDIERPTFLDNYQLISRREVGPWPAKEEKAPVSEKQAAG
ncbi:MAG: 2-oxoacid:ferredoxin oxidoreductase subunit beta, partial [Candidatus Hydrogenedentota bacterium]